jgi:hypothetical protein
MFNAVTCALLSLGSSLAIVFCEQAEARLRRTTQECISDVPAAFARLANAPRTDIVLRTNGKVPEPYYLQSAAAKYGIDNHFQGAARLPHFFILSGANYWTRTAQLFIAEMDGHASVGDRLVSRIDVESGEFWHLGGIASAGALVALPLQDGEAAFEHKKFVSSRILFWDFTDPLKPKSVGPEILRHQNGAGAVGLVEIKNGHYILAVSDDVNVEMYISKSRSVMDGFIGPVRAASAPESQIAGQAIQLLSQCDGRVYLLSFENSGYMPPFFNGSDRVTLSEVIGLNNSMSKPIQVTPQKTIDLSCDEWCNFSAASGSYIGTDQHLRLFSSRFHRSLKGSQIHLAEFGEPGN